jgi:hypothetical protein
MARSLERVWPRIVTTDRRFGRPQHVVRNSWRDFDTQLERREDLDWDAIEKGGVNEYGMGLKQVKGEIENRDLNRLLDKVQSVRPDA